METACFPANSSMDTRTFPRGGAWPLNSPQGVNHHGEVYLPVGILASEPSTRPTGLIIVNSGRGSGHCVLGGEASASKAAPPELSGAIPPTPTQGSYVHTWQCQRRERVRWRGSKGL